MAKRSTRKSKGIFSRVYSPLYHLLAATRNVGKSAFKRSGKIVDNGLGFGSDVVKTVTRHSNGIVRNVTARKNRKSRKSRKSRK